MIRHSQRAAFVAGTIALSVALVGCGSTKGSQSTHPSQNTGDRSASVTADASSGRALFEARCGKCHDLPDPASEPADEWPFYVEEMAERAHLDARGQALVTAYLQAAARAAGR